MFSFRNKQNDLFGYAEEALLLYLHLALRNISLTY